MKHWIIGMTCLTFILAWPSELEAGHGGHGGRGGGGGGKGGKAFKAYQEKNRAKRAATKDLNKKIRAKEAELKKSHDKDGDGRLNFSEQAALRAELSAYRKEMRLSRDKSTKKKKK